MMNYRKRPPRFREIGRALRKDIALERQRQDLETFNEAMRRRGVDHQELEHLTEELKRRRHVPDKL